MGSIVRTLVDFVGWVFRQLWRLTVAVARWTVASLEDLGRTSGATQGWLVAFFVVVMAGGVLIGRGAAPAGRSLPAVVASPERVVVVVTSTPQPSPVPSSTRAPTNPPKPTVASAASPTPRATEAAVATSVPTAAKVRQVPLPGLAAADVSVNLESRGFACSGVHVGDDLLDWSCKREAASYELVVDYYGESLKPLCFINSIVLQFGTPDDAFAASFLGFMATMPYDGAEPERARAWVEETLSTITEAGDVRTETFGGVMYRLFGIPTARTLQIGSLK